MQNDKPFELPVRILRPTRTTGVISCQHLVRSVPGNREVFEAAWNNKKIIVKVFTSLLRSRRHAKREWRGLFLLQAIGLNSPKPVFLAKTKTGRWAVGTEFIDNCVNVIDLFRQMDSPAEKINLLTRITRELAAHHGKGVLQHDLHLGNFLIDSDKVFALDPAQMEILSSPPAKKKCISQLAALACCLPDDNADAQEQLLSRYLAARGWDLKPAVVAIFRKELVVQKQIAVHRSLKKTLRTGKRNFVIKDSSYFAVFSRDFCSPGDTSDFISRVDSLMDSGQILKKGNTCFVSRFTWNGRDIVVKRYNHKNLFHSIRQTFKRSRARRCWLNGHRLLMLDVATPRPLAFIEVRKGPVVWKSYIVMEFVSGPKLYDLLKTADWPTYGAAMFDKVIAVIKRLGKYLVTHGDLKFSNILITDKGPVLTDLDAMRRHLCTYTYNRRMKKSLETVSRMHPETSDFVLQLRRSLKEQG